MTESEVKLCKNCVRWYNTGADQCNVPCLEVDRNDSFHLAVYGKKEIKDLPSYEFIKSKQDFVHFYSSDKAYGHPSQLNKDHECIFYKALPKPLRFLTKIIRNFY